MTSQRIEKLIDEALALPAGQRQAYAERACGPDSALRERLLRSLQAAESDAGFLDRPALKSDTIGATPSVESASTVDRRIGAFRLVRRLGAGGMGEVWLAEREQGDFTQIVALKIMLPGAGPALERFKIERRILASLEHPGIARLHDGGVTEEGWPWMAMEYIEGQELLAWCSARSSGLKERLNLFVQICDAVAYAHSHLVVHRDLKPANVFVTADGQIKLLDFGLAKLLTPDPSSAGAQTAYFSPAYAAPEQLGTGAVTTATDVFALGVTLYQLLCEQLPWPSRQAALGSALERMLGDAPAAPSRVAHGLVAAALLRGDLDAIIAKALRHDPKDRYADARALGDDLRRHLRHEPVEARAGARAYVARRFLRRHWLPLTAAVTVFAALLAGMAGMAWQTRRAAEAGARAAATRDFLIGVFKASDPRIARDKPRGEITARELLDINVGRIDAEFAGDPVTKIQLLGIAADIYRELDEVQRYTAVHQRYEDAARQYYGAADPLTLAAMLDDAVQVKEDLKSAEALRQLAVLDPLIHDAGLDRTPLRAKWWITLGGALTEDSSRMPEQIAALSKAVDLLAEVAPDDPMRVTALADLGNVYSGPRQFVTARRYMEQAIAVSRVVKNRDEAELSTIYSNLGLISQNTGDFEAADAAYAHAAEIARHTYGEMGPQTWVAAAQRARTVHLSGNRERAATLFADLLKSIPAEATDHEATEARDWYAGTLAAEGRPQEALPWLEAAERTYQTSHRYDFELPRVRLVLGDAYARLGRASDARRTLSAALEQRLASDAPDFQPVLAIRERWGRFLLAQREVPAAQAQFREVITQAHGIPLSHAALAYGGMARVALATGDTPAALEASATAVEVFGHVTGFRDVRMGPYLWLIRSDSLRAGGDLAHAREWAQRALEASRRYDDPSAASIRDAETALRRL